MLDPQKRHKYHTRRTKMAEDGRQVPKYVSINKKNLEKVNNQYIIIYNNNEYCSALNYIQ